MTPKELEELKEKIENEYRKQLDCQAESCSVCGYSKPPAGCYVSIEFILSYLSTHGLLNSVREPITVEDVLIGKEDPELTEARNEAIKAYEATKQVPVDKLEASKIYSDFLEKSRVFGAMQYGLNHGRAPITINDIEVDFNKLQEICNEWETLDIDKDQDDYINSRKSEFLKIKGSK